MKPDKKIHFGMIAIEKGFVTADQVLKALNKQLEEQAETGIHSWIGTILSEMGALTLAHLDEVIRELEKHYGNQTIKESW